MEYKKMKNSSSISIKEKILIISQVIAGEKIQGVARKHGVSRPSVYAWTGKALDTLEQALKLERRGPKCKKAESMQKVRSLKNNSF